ncbi:helix-turn-helix domain-containing protein [Streptomyces sp. NBC_00820]|uniref:ArsR/SmtB family transcription factor n=1 Tax=Streptomyces sp. NBC_00820 TaxID=2975842 RepID=UPI002ED2EF9C|nr:helix-turn-helix domain-containing protein [Streptomyces sp. NBC_00820]
MEAQAQQQPEGTSHRTPPVHANPADVALETALLALADPVRQILVRELAGGGDWERACGSFDVPVTKATLSRHFAVLREAGLLEQRDAGPKRLNRLRRAEFDARFPGLLDLVLRQEGTVQ